MAQKTYFSGWRLHYKSLVVWGKWQPCHRYYLTLETGNSGLNLFLRILIIPDICNFKQSPELRYENQNPIPPNNWESVIFNSAGIRKVINIVLYTRLSNVPCLFSWHHLPVIHASPTQMILLLTLPWSCHTSLSEWSPPITDAAYSWLLVFLNAYCRSMWDILHRDHDCTLYP